MVVPGVAQLAWLRQSQEDLKIFGYLALLLWFPNLLYFVQAVQNQADFPPRLVLLE
jgi:hypothetical protein